LVTCQNFGKISYIVTKILALPKFGKVFFWHQSEHALCSDRGIRKLNFIWEVFNYYHHEDIS
jgi:hypothetical protein